jgi:UDP-N-acetyl-2-amino-2-deoxyglucuronate dehydrogenase
MNQAIHTVDLLQWCMGPVVSVMASSSNLKHTNIEVEDTIVALLKFANGALGTLECSTAIYPGELKKIEIMGTQGSAILEDNHLIKWSFEQPVAADQHMIVTADTTDLNGGVADPMAIRTLGHQHQIEDLMEAIHSDRVPLVSGEEGRKAVAIVLAIYKSAQTGTQVEIV